MSSDQPTHHDPLDADELDPRVPAAAEQGDDVNDGNGTILGREPVLIYALVQALITVAVTFGLHLTPEQIGALLVATGAVLSVIVRSKVTPA